MQQEHTYIDGATYKLDPKCPCCNAPFSVKGVQRELRGAREDEYNQPAASDLIQVIDGGPGLPITLSCVFLLVGRRLELEVDGCNCPGHFMARAIVSGRPVLVDCFSGGRLLGDSIIMTLRDSDRRALINAADLRATPEQIVAAAIELLT